jgi:hypothetical protein
MNNTLLCFSYRLYSSNGHKSIGMAVVAIRGAEAKIPEGAEAWRRCGGAIWPMDVSYMKATKKTNRNDIGCRVSQKPSIEMTNDVYSLQVQRIFFNNS